MPALPMKGDATKRLVLRLIRPQTICLFIACVLCCQVGAVSACAQGAAQQSSFPRGLYDPTRDAEKDIRDAMAQAKGTHRHVLIDVGGEWCSWCHIMDRYFDEHPTLTALRDKNFVFIRVNFSPDNENTAVLSRYPAISGYPHLFVLDADGKLLHSQPTNRLESGRSYDLEKFTAFLTEWAPSAARRQ